MEYKISAQLLQAIANNLLEEPARRSMGLLLEIQKLMQEQQPPKEEPAVK